MATYANIYIDQGSDFHTTFEVASERLDPVDFSGVDVRGQIRRTYMSETAYDFEIHVIDPSTGYFAVSLDSEVTSVMRSGRYVYDIYAIDQGGGDSYKLIEGQVEIVPSVTRA
jgi:hypothetical protein